MTEEVNDGGVVWPRCSVLAGNSNLNDDTLASLVVANPQLTQLRVPRCRFVGKKGLESVVHHCSSIRFLDIQVRDYRMRQMRLAPPVRQYVGLVPGCTAIDKGTLRLLLSMSCSASLEGAQNVQ
eukprot:1181607-Prorocentrum_minimum.AAC.5